MKTLNEIKEEYAKENGCKSWRDLTQYDLRQQDVDEVAKRYAIEVAKEALKNASENAITEQEYKSNGVYDYYKTIVSKQSILSENNIPKELL